MNASSFLCTECSQAFALSQGQHVLHAQEADMEAEQLRTRKSLLLRLSDPCADLANAACSVRSAAAGMCLK